MNCDFIFLPCQIPHALCFSQFTLQINFPGDHVGFVLQPVNVFGYGSQAAQDSQTIIAPSNTSGPMSGAANFDDAVSGKMGKPYFK